MKSRGIVSILVTLMLVLGSQIPMHQVADAQGGITIGAPTLTLLDTGCLSSSLDGNPNWPDRGDNLAIATTLTNNTSSSAEFRVVFRVVGTTGGSGSNLPVDLFYGGLTYMHEGSVGVAYWDDSYGEVYNTPGIPDGGTHTAKVNFGLLAQQLANALNLNPSGGNPAPTTLTFRVEVFSSDFSTYYGTATTTQTVQYTHNNDCPGGAQLDDASPVILTASKTYYSLTETAWLEWSMVSGDEVHRVPGWRDSEVADVDVVWLPAGSSGDCETDYASGIPVMTLGNSSWTGHFPTQCASPPCPAMDESLGSVLYWGPNSGEILAWTNWTSFGVLELGGGVGQYVARLDPTSAGTPSHPIPQPQCTYFLVGAGQTAIALKTFSARAAHSLLVPSVETAAAVLVGLALIPTALALGGRLLRRRP